MHSIHRLRTLLLFCLPLLQPGDAPAAEDSPQPPPALRNPFLYPNAAPAARSASGAIPVAGNHLPAGVRVRATVQLAEAAPAAVVEIPGYPQLFHLHVGDQFSLDGSAGLRRTAGRPGTTPPHATGVDAAVVFTVVGIDRHTVTVSQSRRPDELIVIR